MFLLKTLTASPVFTMIQIPALNMHSPNRNSSLQPNSPICSYPNTPCLWVYALVHTEIVCCPSSPCQNIPLSERYSLNFTCSMKPWWPRLETISWLWMCTILEVHGTHLGAYHVLPRIMVSPISTKLTAETETQSSSSMHSTTTTFFLIAPSAVPYMTGALMGVWCWWWYD